VVLKDVSVAPVSVVGVAGGRCCRCGAGQILGALFLAGRGGRRVAATPPPPPLSPGLYDAAVIKDVSVAPVAVIGVVGGRCCRCGAGQILGALFLAGRDGRCDTVAALRAADGRLFDAHLWLLVTALLGLRGIASASLLSALERLLKLSHLRSPLAPPVHLWALWCLHFKVRSMVVKLLGGGAPRLRTRVKVDLMRRQVASAVDGVWRRDALLWPVKRRPTI